MTFELLVPTPFSDLAEFGENFAGRVDQGLLVLPSPEAPPTETWVRFLVQLADGSDVLLGTGRCTDTNDNGESEEVDPQYRFDLYLDSLSFENGTEQLYNQLLEARGLEPHVQAEDAAPAPAEPSGLGAVPVASAWEDDEVEAATFAGSVEEFQPAAPAPVVAAPVASAPPPAPPAASVRPNPPTPSLSQPPASPSLPPASPSLPPASPTLPPASPTLPPATPSVAPLAGSIPPTAPSAPREPRSVPRGIVRPPAPLPAMHTFDEGLLLRPSLTPTWAPEPPLRPEPAESTGFFDFEGGLPVPAAPPRPDLPEEAQVVPAPSPSAPWSAAAEG